MNNSTTRTVPALIARMAIVLVLIGGGFFVKSSFFTSPSDFAGPGGKSVTFSIEAGDSLATIANKLKVAGVVASVDRFLNVAQLNPKSANIQPGTYGLRLEMSAQKVLEGLIAGENRTSNGIVIPEGKQASWIIEEISKQTNTPIAQLKYEIANPDKLGLPRWANGNVEGFLYPATYNFVAGTSAREMLSQMIAEFLTQSQAMGLETKAAKLGKSPLEILTIASLLQAESHPSDFRKVARVIYNRLDIDMRLQFDSTVNYGLGLKTVILNEQQLAKDTKYNTYIYAGLPPTPINNPGLVAIQAGLSPESGSWIYFVTVDLRTQLTRFTDSYTQFLEYKREFLNYCSTNRGEC